LQDARDERAIRDAVEPEVWAANVLDGLAESLWLDAKMRATADGLTRCVAFGRSIFLPGDPGRIAAYLRDAMPAQGAPCRVSVIPHNAPGSGTEMIVRVSAG
jgi:hypothetical protein